MTKESDYAGRLRGWIGHPACPAQAVQDDLRAGAAEIERLHRRFRQIRELPCTCATKLADGCPSCIAVAAIGAADEPSEGYSQAYADQMRNALLTIATSSLTPDRVRQFAHKGLLRSFPVEPSPEKLGDPPV